MTAREARLFALLVNAQNESPRAAWNPRVPPLNGGARSTPLCAYVRDLNEHDSELFWRALKPGGIVVYENSASEGNEVLKAFLRYRVVRFENVVDRPDWNPGQQTRLERLIAEKP